MPELLKAISRMPLYAQTWAIFTSGIPRSRAASNFTMSINPGFPNFSVDVWVPDGPERTRGFSGQYFGPGASRDFAEALIAFNRQVSAEDAVLTDSSRAGYGRVSRLRDASSSGASIL